MEDFVKLFGLAMFGQISEEDFLIECGMSPEEAKELIEETNKDGGRTV
jgi:hypothetical protein